MMDEQEKKITRD